MCNIWVSVPIPLSWLCLLGNSRNVFYLFFLQMSRISFPPFLSTHRTISTSFCSSCSQLLLLSLHQITGILRISRSFSFLGLPLPLFSLPINCMISSYPVLYVDICSSWKSFSCHYLSVQGNVWKLCYPHHGYWIIVLLPILMSNLALLC